MGRFAVRDDRKRLSRYEMAINWDDWRYETTVKASNCSSRTAFDAFTEDSRYETTINGRFVVRNGVYRTVRGTSGWFFRRFAVRNDRKSVISRCERVVFRHFSPDLGSRAERGNFFTRYRTTPARFFYDDRRGDKNIERNVERYGDAPRYAMTVGECMRRVAIKFGTKELISAQIGSDFPSEALSRRTRARNRRSGRSVALDRRRNKCVRRVAIKFGTKELISAQIGSDFRR